MRLHWITLLAAAVVATSACGTTPQATVQVAKSLGSRQCEGGGTAPSALARELTGAGVKVLSTQCGNDGLMHPALCGVGDGRLAVFEIGAQDLSVARGLGFSVLGGGSDARVVSCP